jgi:NADH:ubiquinone oxidoreductase subunit 4 (subunit M)
MKIKQEHFDKLSQLDRIEYRQIEDRINETYKTGFMGFFDFLVPIIILASIFLLLSHLASPEAIHLESVRFYCSSILIVAGISMGVVLILDFRTMFLKSKRMDELQEKYFGINVKGRK